MKNENQINKGKIQTLLHEKEFEIFYEDPIYELSEAEKESRLMNLIRDCVESRLEHARAKTPWPEVDFIFGEDEHYQQTVSNIMGIVTQSLNQLEKYACDNYSIYCEMIRSILKLNIEEALECKTFTSNDYYILLHKHTEFLNSMNSMCIDERIGGIFRFMAREFQSNCLPYTLSVLKSIDSHVPPIAIKKNEKLQETLRVI